MRRYAFSLFIQNVHHLCSYIIFWKYSNFLVGCCNKNVQTLIMCTDCRQQSSRRRRKENDLIYAKSNADNGSLFSTYARRNVNKVRKSTCRRYEEWRSMEGYVKSRRNQHGPAAFQSPFLTLSLDVIWQSLFALSFFLIVAGVLSVTNLPGFQLGAYTT